MLLEVSYFKRDPTKKVDCQAGIIDSNASVSHVQTAVARGRELHRMKRQISPTPLCPAVEAAVAGYAAQVAVMTV